MHLPLLDSIDERFSSIRLVIPGLSLFNYFDSDQVCELEHIKHVMLVTRKPHGRLPQEPLCVKDYWIRV